MTGAASPARPAPTVGLYQDPRGPGVGGGEFVLAVLAHTLRAEGHAVDLVHHQGAGFANRLADFFKIDLTGVGDRSLPDSRWNVPDAPSWRVGAALRGWMREASEPYHLFVCVTHRPPPFCHARNGVLYVLFPMFDRHASWPWNARGRGPGRVYAWLRRHVYERLWAERMRSYRAVAAISRFAADWTRNYWGLEPGVVYPPVNVDEFAPGQKEDRVAVLGRFTRLKNQAALARTFRAHRDRFSGWTLSCVGGLGDSAAEREYFAEVERAAGDACELVVNAPRAELRDRLGRAKVFWHAMGIDVDEGTDPAAIEHFGIATVEAMAAGCVPVVVARGGQAEIVTDGETGFLCRTFDEFADRTAELAADPARLARMSAAARDRSAAFSRRVFVERMMAVLRPYLPVEGGAP